VLLASISLIAGATEVSAQNRLKVILDTDIGDDIDDAWAVAFAMRSPALDLLGVTITHGNTPARAKVACKLLHATGHSQVPVAIGRQTGTEPEYQFTWAEDFTAKQPITQPAADFIVDTVRKYPGEVVLMAVGPLENLADAVRREPNLPKLVKRVVLMSGSIGPSAWSSAAIAEWNVVSSTADAQVVYAAGLPLTIVPLDSTTYVRLNDDERERVRSSKTAVGHALEALYRLWLEGPSERMTLHDQMAIAETVRPGAFFGRCDLLSVFVDDKGFTRVDATRGKPTTVCLEPKRDAFMKFYLDGLTAPDSPRPSAP
jgi:inosine-uridine nucleoside N-ribohydrolase